MSLPIESAETAQQIFVRRRWLITALLFFAGLINYFDRTIVSVALPVIAADLHIGPARMGMLLSAFFWSYALMQVPIGGLADRFNLRWLYAGCFALWSFTCGLTGFAASLGVMVVLRMLLGIGESIYLPGGMKAVSVLFAPKDRGLASGLVNCGTRAGLAFGAPLIAALVVAFGWHVAFSCSDSPRCSGWCRGWPPSHAAPPPSPRRPRRASGNSPRWIAICSA